MSRSRLPLPDTLDRWVLAALAVTGLRAAWLLTHR